MALAYFYPRDGGNVTLDDGTKMLAKDALAAGYSIVHMTSSGGGVQSFAKPPKGRGKTAAAHPFDENLVVTPDNGIMRRTAAASLGYTLPPLAKPDAAAQAAHDARVEQFVSLPEAVGKVRSAVKLAADYSAAEMPEARPRAFLRGAPTDAALTAQRQAQRQPQPTATAPADPRAARLEEIRRLGKRR